MLYYLLAALVALAILIAWEPLGIYRRLLPGFARIVDAIKARLVSDARNFHRWWSVRFNALGLLILGWVQIDPVSVLGIWNAMPPHVRAFLPPNFLTYAGMALFSLSMLARMVDQKKLREQRHG